MISRTKQQPRKSRKKQYRIRNWKAYNQALVSRGSLDVWIAPDIADVWYAEPSGTPGVPPVYSALAIETMLTLRKLFALPLRSTEGLLTSLFRLAEMELSVPDYSTLSRRQPELAVRLTRREKEKTTLILDSSGLKVYGEGEWKVRQHGYSKRRKWKKVHVAIDEEGEARAVEATENDVHDSEQAASLMRQETATIETCAGDGAYDTRTMYAACQERTVQTILIPPRCNAHIWRHGNRPEQPHPRDANLRLIRTLGRKQWKEQSGYHIRSGVENFFFRLKTIFGDRLQARGEKSQKTEITLMCNALNKMLSLGMPESYAVT